MSYKASAPGSLMLFGEYAVLHGETAVACAIDKRIIVELIPRDDKKLLIHSALGEYSSDINKIKVTSPFEFVLTALKTYKLKKGCDIHITSEFSHEVGFGSSAAVTVATLSVLHAMLAKKVNNMGLIRQAIKVIHAVQKRGSGTDVAASVLGGIVAYDISPLKVKKYSFTPPISVVYVGYKTPTHVALEKMKKKFQKQKKLYQYIFSSIGQCSKDAKTAIGAKNWRRIGEMMNVQQGLLDALGVNTPDIQQYIDFLRTNKNIYGAKISGSGLGDCVIGIGANIEHPNAIPVAITLKGVTYEKN